MVVEAAFAAGILHLLPPLVGIEPRRAHLVINDEVTFSRAPLQARKVGFPDSGFDLDISPRGLPEMEQA